MNRRPKGRKYKGVYLHRKKWIEKIMLNGVSHYLGMFSSHEDAAAAYNARALELFGASARLNLIRRRNPRKARNQKAT